MLPIILAILLAPSAAIVIFAVGFGRAAAVSDRASEESFRALVMRRLARRRGERRAGDRRRTARPISVERRIGERRLGERRLDPTRVDPPAAAPPAGMSVLPVPATAAGRDDASRVA